MAIRLPLTTLLDYNQTTENGAGVAGVNASVAGGQALPFLIPQDCDNVVVKFSASILAGAASAVFQTSDDGGSTWYDVGRTSIVSNANATTAEWLSTPVIGTGVGTTYVSGTVPSVGGQAAASIYGAIGSAAASTLGQKAVSGLPILGREARIFIRYTAAITSVISMRATVSANSQATSSN
jgi:hypothetical protein